MKKINSIKFKNFKAFYGEEPIQLDGKNLLVYGENGSGKSSSLEIIDISGSELDPDWSITRLPNEIGQLKNLRELRASYGALTSIPSSIAECESLQILDLDNNPFISIPFSL
jgi:ABC-type molybdenum transport system ATPase subunit/photorepair protein PhrA